MGSEIHAMSETPPIYFSTLEIENVRCFGGPQVLELTDNGRPAPWSLLIGENGTGKTTLLECLAWMRPVPEVNGGSGVPAGQERPRGYVPFSSGRLNSALTSEENEVLETLPRVGSRALKLRAKLRFGGVGFGPEPARSQANNFSVGVQLSFDEQALLSELVPKRARIKRLGEFHDPLFMVSYGANRYLGERNSRGFDEPDTRDHERLSRSTELYDLEEILMSLHYAASIDSQAREGPSLKRLKEAISRVLLEHQDDDKIEIHPPDMLESGRPSGVYVKTFTGLLRMSALSMGHQTTAGWVGDLAWRFLNRYPESPNPLAEPAVVLIDEIDLHLHPRWQLNIMKDLSLLFPATQFIATSHSPLIVQVAETANLVLLRKRGDYVEIVNDPGVPKNLRVDQILTSLAFGVPSRSKRMERLFAQRAELADKTERTQEEEYRLSDVRRQISELPTAEDPDDRDAMDLIRQFANRLKSEKATRK